MREEYIRFCNQLKDLPVFYHAWWLDIVTDGNWIPMLVKDQDGIIASWGLPYKKKYGQRQIRMPQLTPKAGPYLVYPENQNHKQRRGFEKKTIRKLIDNLPAFSWFDLAFDVSLDNWLPFYWNGFKQYTRYTYRFTDIEIPGKALNYFDYSKIKNVNKAKGIVKIEKGLSIDVFLQHLEGSFAERGEKLFYSGNFLKELYHGTMKNDAGEIYYAIDDRQNIHAALFLVWDQVTAYTLISSISPAFKGSGAYTYLIYYLIEELSGRVRMVDLEGSMVESVEQSFRRLGATQTPYFQISKANNILIDIYRYLTGK